MLSPSQLGLRFWGHFTWLGLVWGRLLGLQRVKGKRRKNSRAKGRVACGNGNLVLLVVVLYHSSTDRRRIFLGRRFSNKTSHAR